MSTVSVAQNTPIEIDTSVMQPGVDPEDFTFGRTGQGAGGKWTVVGDPTAAKGRAIAQISKDRTDYRFPLAVYKPFSDKTLEIALRFKPRGGDGRRGRRRRSPFADAGRLLRGSCECA